jgi:hypothetical protein
VPAQRVLAAERQLAHVGDLRVEQGGAGLAAVEVPQGRKSDAEAC